MQIKFTLFVAAICCLFALATSDMLLHLDVSQQTNVQNATTSLCYGAMMDAGSSGTRAYVYKWPCRSTYTYPKIDISQVAPNFRVTPGISTFGNNIGGIQNYITPLINYVKNQIGANTNTTLSKIPLLLRATAGMRLLNQTQQIAVMNETLRVMKASGMYVKDDYAKVISGSDEGVFGWIALNYLNGKLAEIAANSSIKSVPISDLGGASVQITFEPTETVFANSYNLTMPGVKSFNLYTYSYLGWGADQARENTMQLAPVVNGERQYPCFLVGYNISNPQVSGELVVGTGNATACLELIDRYNNVTNGASIRGNPQPIIPSDQQLYGISTYRYQAEYLSYTGGNVTADQLVSGATTYCATAYQTAYAQSGNSSFAYSTCFNSLFAARMISAFRYPTNKIVDVKPSIANNEVTWAMGSMIYDVAQIPCTNEACVAPVASSTRTPGVTPTNSTRVTPTTSSRVTPTNSTRVTPTTSTRVVSSAKAMFTFTAIILAVAIMF